ncbi:RES family NAD+ phosphorylase [Chelativorans sp. J32]|uniref:RES family NAD+ phosphorylase n=1 Tax=Chelativorans sp. J32 TaxID=935840 RepID=UPI0004806D1A|nr:RES family NAD+ phosphorylase [Chelativorans sp. J32]
MRFVGTCYRAHDPRWSFKPISGDGAAIRGARFNPKGIPALYLALSIMTAVKEINQGLAYRIDPCVLCSYDVDCDHIVDLRTAEARDAAGIRYEDMACAWMNFLAEGERPPSWSIYDRLAGEGASGILVPSFAPGAEEADQNLVLWSWGEEPPHKVCVIDPSGRLPRNQLSWR